MPNFRWPSLFHDISLCKKVYSVRPEKPSDWESIAQKLSKVFTDHDDKGQSIAVKGRGCRERLELLVKKFRDEDRKALKRYVSFICIVKL